jgi:hypothetical protein
MRGKGLKACAAKDFLPVYQSRNEERFLVAAAARLLGMTANSISGVESLLP